MNIYVTHWIVLVLLRLLILDIVQMHDTTQIFIIYLLTMLIALPVLNKLINTIESSFIHE